MHFVFLSYYFLQLPGAKDAAVVVDDKVFFLEPTKINEAMSRWEGVITIPSVGRSRTVVVAARWNDEQSLFPELLVYETKC